MGRPKDKSETRKKDILDNFYTVLAQEGLEGASIAKVAGRMDINPSLVIHYFSTKEEMVVALVDRVLEMYEETFLPQLSGIEDPAERMEAAADAFFGSDWAQLVDHGVFYACYSLSFRNRKVRKSLQRMYSRLRELLMAEMGHLMEKGAIARGDPGLLADMVISLLEGYDFYRWIIEEEKQREEFGRFLKERVLEMLRANR
jgi:AcrR family transcriptional regulator